MHNGESYEGNFKPIVSQAAFAAVQQVLSNGRRIRVKKNKHNFSFLGLLKCGECGGAITAQYAKKKYIYYRCTKKLGKCGQKYIGEKKLVDQLTERLTKVALNDDWKEKMLAKVKIWESEQKDDNKSFAQNLEQKIKEAETKLDKLVNAYLDGTIEKEIYLVKKNELIQTKTDLNNMKSDFGRKACPPYAYRRERASDTVTHGLPSTVTTSDTGFGRRGNNWLEPLKQWIIDANYAKKLALSKDFIAIKSFAEKIGTNRRLLNREVVWEWREEWKILADFNAEFKNFAFLREPALRAGELREHERLCMSETRELNPNYIHPSPA